MGARSGVMRAFFKILLVPLRIATVLAMLSVALALAGALFFKVMVTPEELKNLIVLQLQDAFHRPVQVSEVKFLIYQGLRVRGLRVLQGKGFPGDAFISSEYLLVKYKWSALLQRRVEFNELRLVSPRIHLVRNAEGRWNVEDIVLSNAARSSKVSAGPFSMPVDLSAKVIAVERGEMRWEDLPGGRGGAVHAFDLHVVDFDLKRPFAVSASFQNTLTVSGRRIDTRCSLRGSVSLAGLQWSQAALSAERLRVQVGDKTLHAEGLLKGFKRPSIEAKVSLPPLDSAFLSQWRPVAEGISLPPSSWKLSLSRDASGTWTLDSLDAVLGPSRLRARGGLEPSGPRRRFHASIRLEPSPVDGIAGMWKDWERHNLSGTVSGSASFSGVWGSSATLPLLGSYALEFTGLAGVFPPDTTLFHLDGSIRGDGGLQESTVTVRRGAVVAYGITLSDLDLLLRTSKEHMDIERLRLGWNHSEISLKGRVKGLRPPREVLLDVSVDTLKLDDLINTVQVLVSRLGSDSSPPRPSGRARPWSRAFKYSIPKEFPATAGRLRVGELRHPHVHAYHLEGIWNLDGISTGLERATGNIQLGFGPGRVTDVSALQSAHKVLWAIFLPFVYMHKLNSLTQFSLATAVPNVLDFTRIYGEYGLDRGVVDMRLFHVDSPQLLAYSDGTIDFPKETADLHMLTRLTSSRGTLPEYLVDEKGRPSFGFFVEGNLNKPDLRLEFGKMGENALESALQRGFKRSRKVFVPF